MWVFGEALDEHLITGGGILDYKFIWLKLKLDYNWDFVLSVVELGATWSKSDA